MLQKIGYEYEVTATTHNGEQLQRTGSAECYEQDLDPDYFEEEHEIWQKALQSAMEHFWLHTVEKPAHGPSRFGDVSEISITIRNVKDEYE